MFQLKKYLELKNVANIFLSEARKGFLGSILIGIAIWSFFFITLPVEVVNAVSGNTILFILLNYVTLILGFYIFKKRNTLSGTIEFDKRRIERLLQFFTLLVFFSALIRYFDLLYVREVSFFNPIRRNKYNLAQEENFSLLLGLLSVFRLLYFVPFAIYQMSEKKKTYLIVAILFFFIPIVEGLLRGSRRLLLEPVLIFAIILILQRRKRLSLNWKKLTMGLVVLLLLFFSSQFIMKQRMAKTSEEFEKALVEAQYNDLVPLTEDAKRYIIDNKESIRGSMFLFYCHLGQYINHGVFEFDHLTKIDSDPKYGLYNGFIVVKLFNKAKLTNYPLEELNNPAERITYVTHFGGLYIDFRWFSLAVMFLFGLIQAKTFTLSEKYLTLKPILILFVLINMTMLIFNFLRAQIFVTIVVYFLSLVVFRFLERRKLLK